MRNVGLDLVTTSHVLTIDVDFVPSQDLDLLVRERALGKANTNTNTGQQRQQQHRTAVVVPAFERKAPGECDDVNDRASCLSAFLRRDGNFLPKTFPDLRDCYRKGSRDCVVFQSKFNWEGHSSTRSEAWINEHWYDENQDGNENDSNNKDNDRSFRSISCFDTPRYEPYVVLEWCPPAAAVGNNDDDNGDDVGVDNVDNNDGDNNNNYNNDYNVPLLPIAPYYDERFYGYGKNKIELVSHLRWSGYEFRVLPEGFIIHNPHPESKTKETWNKNGKDKDKDGNNNSNNKLHSTMDALYKKFLRELEGMYHHKVQGDSIVVKPCEMHGK